MSEVISIVLAVVAGLLIFDRILTDKRIAKERSEWTSERSRLIKAVMAKDINEYTAAVIADKVTVDIDTDPDEIPLSEADDKLFDKHIASTT